jgi:hypothetical protein
MAEDEGVRGDSDEARSRRDNSQSQGNSKAPLAHQSTLARTDGTAKAKLKGVLKR